MNSPTSTRDLLPSERRFLAAISELRYGRFEHLPIECGQLAPNHLTKVTRIVKLGSQRPPAELPSEFDLKQNVTEFLAYVRSVERGEIRSLQILDGLPVTMEIEGHPDRFWRRCPIAQ